MEQYQYISASYEDCVKAERWFVDNKPVDSETTWELYKRFDPKEERAMNQASFYSLLPREWKESGQYRYVNVTYQSCRDVDTWCESQSLPMKNVTAEKILSNYDPVNHSGWDVKDFYHVLPGKWRGLVLPPSERGS
jgi:hypothetical protein